MPARSPSRRARRRLGAILSLVIMCVTTSCTPIPEERRGILDQTETEWRATDDRPGAVTITFAGPDHGTLGGNDGCNGFGGGFRLEDSTILFTSVASQLVGCASGDYWLEDVSSLRIDGSQLVGLDRQNEELGRLEKVSE